MTINNLEITSEGLAWQLWCSTRNRRGGGSSLTFIESQKGRLWSTIKIQINNAHTHFVTLSSNNYKFLTFPQISFDILSCHSLLISLYYISTLFVSSVQNPRDSFLTFTLSSVRATLRFWGEPRHDNDQIRIWTKGSPKCRNMTTINLMTTN